MRASMDESDGRAPASERRSRGRWAAVVAVLGSAAGVGLAASAGLLPRGPGGPGEPGAADAMPPAPQDVARGEALFARHCAVCHGTEGRGDGSAAYLLFPPPRDFGAGRFRLASTDNGVPTQEDLIATLERGMPGSAMPPWEWLAEEDLWLLADRVRTLAVEGITADLLADAEANEDELSREEALEIARERLRPGAPAAIPAPLPGDPVVLQEGRRVYSKLCASCHAEDGTGNVTIELFDENGTPTAARDFTAGIFKGGSSAEELMRRIRVGLPGSPMPETELERPEDYATLAAYVRSLIRPGAEELVLQRRRTIPVARVAELPTDPDAPAWRAKEAVWIALMPLWWRDARIEGVVVRALHDGERIAFRLSWRDATQDAELLGASTFSDGAAVELSTQEDPPLFAMGARDEPVDIVLWRAAWEQDLAAVRDVEDRHPGMVHDTFLDRLPELRESTLTARAAGNPMSLGARATSSEDLVARGFGTVGPPPDGLQHWTASGRWADGFWDVVLSRPLEEHAEVALAPRAHAYMAFAVWDGAAGDRNGQKAVSVWHRLEIAP